MEVGALFFIPLVVEVPLGLNVFVNGRRVQEIVMIYLDTHITFARVFRVNAVTMKPNGYHKTNIQSCLSMRL